MRMMLAFIAVLCSTAALAQSAPPPTDLRAKPHTAPGKLQSVAVRLQSCLDIDDGTKERLNCYDAVIAPMPNAKAPAAKGVKDCKFTKEEDQRLACFNGFVESMPKLPKS